jgi:hypothetical protein
LAVAFTERGFFEAVLAFEREGVVDFKAGKETKETS